MALLEKNLNFIWYGDSCDTDCEGFPFYSGPNLVEGFQNVISVAQIKPAGYVFSYWSRETDTENRESYENLPDLIKNNLGLSNYVVDSQGFVKFECGKAYVVKLDEGTQLELPGAVVINLGSESTRGLQALPCPTCPEATECECEKIDLIFLNLDINTKTFGGWTEQLSACMEFSQGVNAELFMSTNSVSVGTKLYLEERQYQDDGFTVSNQWVVANGMLYRIDDRTIVEIVNCEDIIPTPTPTPEFAVPSSTICISESTFNHYNGDYLYTGTKHNNRPVWGPNQDGAYLYYEAPAGVSEARWMLSKALGSKLGQYANVGALTAYPYDVSWDGDDDYTHVIGTEECPTPTPTPTPTPFVPEVVYVDVCTTRGTLEPSLALGDAVAVNGKPVYFDFRSHRDSERWDNYADYLVSVNKTHSPITLGGRAVVETSDAFDALGVEVSVQYEPDTDAYYLAFANRIAYYYDQDESVYGIGTSNEACADFDSTMPIPGFEIWPLLCGTGAFMEVWDSDDMCFEPSTPTPTPTPTPIPADCSDTTYCVSGITGAYAEYNGTYVPGGKDLDGMDYWQQSKDLHGLSVTRLRFIREKSQEFRHGDDDVHYQHNYVFTSRLPTTKLDYFIAITNPPITSPRMCPHEFEWDSFGISPGYFDNMAIATDKCPPPMANSFVFRKIDFAGKQYRGWDEASLYTACVDAEEGLIVDTLTLWRTYDAPLAIGTELFMSTESRFHEDFDVKGEWVYASGTLFKLTGRVITDVIDCDAVSEPTPTPQEPPWCGEPPEKDTYICVQGSGETAGKFDRPIDGRYYYSLQSPSDKTEWQSRNSLIYLTFLDTDDERNELGIDIWAFYVKSGTKRGILYYTTEFDPESYCPPFETTNWIPTGQMSSKFVTIYGFNNCGDSNVDRIPCDVLDAAHEGWFDIPACKNTLNVEQTDAQATNPDCNINYKKYGDEFGVVINRGSGSPKVSEVFMQSEHGSFGMNPNVITPPGVGWYDYPGELPNACGSYEHIIEIPFTKVIDLVSLKMLTSTDRKFAFDVQAFSVETQTWVRLGSTVIHESNQKISMNGKSLGGDSPSSKVSEFKNENYNVSEPPIDGSDVISESISGIRLYVGTWDYYYHRATKFGTNDEKIGWVNPLGEGGHSLVLHSIRVEGRDAADCFPDNVTQLTSAKFQGPTSATPRREVAPTLYPSSVVILGEKCIGTRLHGNYRYDGDVRDILYDWKVNGVSKSTYRYLDTDDLSHGDVVEFSVTFKYLETKSTTYSTNATIERCKTLLLPPNDTSGSFIYLKRENNSDGIPVFEGWPEYGVCDNYNAPWQVQMWWRGTLRQGSKLSLERAYQTHEEIHGTNRWFYHKESRTVVELNTDKVVVSTFQCPPSDVTFSGTSVDEASGYGVQVGGLMSTPYNSNVTYSLVSGEGDTHNSKFVLTGKNTQHSLHNFNVIRSSSAISYNSTKSLKFRIRGTTVGGTHYTEKQFSVNVNPKPIEYFSCHNIKISGYTTEPILNGVYGLEAKTTAYGKFIEYQQVDGKYTYRNKGNSTHYARLMWNKWKSRWDLWKVKLPTSSTSPQASANDMQYLIDHYGIQPGITNPGYTFGMKEVAHPMGYSLAPPAIDHTSKKCPFPFGGVIIYYTPASGPWEQGIVTDAGKFEIGKDWQDT